MVLFFLYYTNNSILQYLPRSVKKSHEEPPLLIFRLRQVSQLKKPNNNNKSKIEKRQSDQRQRNESLKRRKSLPQHGETSSTVNLIKSISVSVSQLPPPTTINAIPALTVPSVIDPSSPNVITTSLISTTIVGQKSNVTDGNLSNNSANNKSSCDMQGLLQFEPIEI